MRALITGITGQDGSYLAELLLEQGYDVVGLTRGGSSRVRLTPVEHKITWIMGDIADHAFVRDTLAAHMPDEVYNLASVATVARPWEDVVGLLNAAALAPLYFLEGIKDICPSARFFQASSAEMYGVPETSPQDEQTPLRPLRPYGIAKEFVHRFVNAYRNDHSLFAVSGILFNHESPRRGEDFITRKVTRSLARIKLAQLESFSCGNLDAKRDWGYAKEYVEGMARSLRHEAPDDYVFATGETHSVRELIEAAGTALALPITWEGAGMDEVGKDAAGMVRVRIDPAFYRPLESIELRGNPAHAKAALGWEAATPFDELMALMAKEDLRDLEKAS